MGLKGIVAPDGTTYHFDHEYLDNNPTIPTVDETLSIEGKYADAKKVGDEFSSLKEDLNVIDGDLYNKYQYKLIEKGTINASTGDDETSGTRARTSGFIDFGHLYGVVVTGNTVQYSLRFWDGETYKGASASWIDSSKTAAELKPNFNITRIKVVFRYANDANIDLYDVLDKVKVIVIK